MEAISADLHLHTVSRGDWTNFSWLLRRKGGNLLVACADVSDILPEIEKLGGLSRVLLTDIHFANAWHGKVANHFGATLVCHESDKAKVKPAARPPNWKPWARAPNLKKTCWPCTRPATPTAACATSGPAARRPRCSRATFCATPPRAGPCSAARPNAK